MKYTFKGNFGLMELTVDLDGNASGTYQKKGSLSGSFKNEKFSGSWKNKGLEGLVDFTISDGILEGNWKKGKEPGPMRSKWKGELISLESNVENEALENADNIEAKDPLFNEARDLILEHSSDSISLFQEKLKVGYNRASRIIAELKEAGIIGAEDLENEAEITLDKTNGNNELDAFFEQAKDISIKNGYALGSLLEDELKIGPNRSKRIIEQLIDSDILEKESISATGVYPLKNYLNTNEKSLNAENDTSSIESTEIIALQKQLTGLRKEENYAEIIKLFEQNKSIAESNEQLVDAYLWSLYLNDGTEKDCLKKTREYEKIFNTNRWFKLKGHVYRSLKWYDRALEVYRNSSERYYQITVDKINTLSSLYKDKKYDEAINYYEDWLYLSVSNDTLYIGEFYCKSLYHSEGNEKKALKKTIQFTKEFHNHSPFFWIAGEIYRYLGKTNLEIDSIKEAIKYFKKAKDSEKITECKELISSIKEKIKQQKAVEKQKVREAAAQEKLKQHQFKNAREQTFCKFCGREPRWAADECEGRIHDHNFILMNVDGNLKPVCNKCGYDSGYSGYSCK
ncbi:hypothetical protein OAK19_00720 [Aureispira]|nr:hypothetical protein [Aureispira sp.]